MRLSGREAASDCGVRRARGTVREDVIDLQCVGVRSVEFACQQASLALSSAAGRVRRRWRTDELYAGRVFNGRRVGVGVNGGHRV